MLTGSTQANVMIEIFFDNAKDSTGTNVDSTTFTKLQSRRFVSEWRVVFAGLMSRRTPWEAQWMFYVAGAYFAHLLLALYLTLQTFLGYQDRHPAMYRSSFHIGSYCHGTHVLHASIEGVNSCNP